jgi:hypothetical protein
MYGPFCFSIGGKLIMLYLLKIRLLNENVFACIKYFLGFFNKKFACFGLLVI